MASVPHGLGQERATVPRIVLPITSRGLVVTDRLCWGLLAAAMVVAGGLILYLNRGTTFFFDEMAWFHSAPGLDLRDVIEPHNGHLVATTRVVYKAILETVGADYVAFRLLGVFSVLLCAALFYAIARRRIGAVPALAPTLVLLFFGSAWQHVLVPVGFTVLFSIAAGLAALLALERGDRRGDVAACGLTVLSVATYTTGLAFLVGVAISVLVSPDRRRRAWIFLVPVALYAAWWLWALQSESSSEGETQLTNILLVPSYFAESLAAVGAALTGLGYGFDSPSQVALELGWGHVVAVLAVVALVLRIRRGAVPPALWAALAIPLAYWLLGALAFGPARGPVSVRYLYPGSVMVLLVATTAASGARFSRVGLALLFAAAAASLATNLALLRDGGALFRAEYSAPLRAQFAMLELARGRVEPGFDPVIAVPEVAPTPKPDRLAPAGFYLASVDRYGSPALPLGELTRQTETVREGADRVLAGALELRIEPSPHALPATGCRLIRGEAPGRPAGFELPLGGASIRLERPAPGAITVGRFAAAQSVELGDIPPGETVALRIPPDSSPQPWRASIAGARSVKVCAL